MIGGTRLHVITVCGLMTGEMIASVITFAESLLVHYYSISHVWCVDGCSNIASGITVYRVMTGAIFRHQSSLCAAMTVEILLHQSSTWDYDLWTITVSVVNVWGVRTSTLLLHHSSPCADDLCLITASVITGCAVMTDGLLLHQSSLCAERWLVKYYWVITVYITHICVGMMTNYCCISHQCVESVDWCTIYTSSQCVKWWLTHYFCINYHC